MKSTIMKVIILLMVGAFFLYIFSVGIRLTEIKECERWQKQIKEYSLFTPNNWQINQCLNYEIKLEK